MFPTALFLPSRPSALKCPSSLTFYACRKRQVHRRGHQAYVKALNSLRNLHSQQVSQWQPAKILFFGGDAFSCLVLREIFAEKGISDNFAY
jgi:hypothetical protein